MFRLNVVSHNLLPTTRDLLSQKDSESIRSITKWTERENRDISSKLKILNPTHKTIVKKMDDEAERVLESMRQDHKQLSLSLKQLISSGINDRTLEPNQAYPLEIYCDRIPLIVKIKIK